MASLTDQQIDQLARSIVARMSGAAPPAHSAAPAACGASVSPRASQRSAPAGGRDDGAAEVDRAVAAAQRAFLAFQEASLATREAVIASMRAAMLTHAEALARAAHAETGLGRWADKVVKNRLVTLRTPGVEDLKPSAVSGDHGLMLMERAPYGVIAAITPSTNPTATIICNAIGMIAAGNAVVFNAHPSAKQVSAAAVALLNQAIQAAGGPVDLITCVEQPTIESAQALMKHTGVRLLVVTGGPGVVQAAMQSGKRAICAGPGNPPVVVDESADVDKAGRDIVRGASFDNNVICTDEKECFVVGSVADALLKSMVANGAVLLNAQQARQIENLIFKERGGQRQASVVDRGLVGKNAGYILSKIGVSAGDEVRLAVLDVPVDHPLVWTEQLMPVFPVARVRSVDEAIDLAVAAEGGRGHTASMHSRKIDKLSRMARAINCSIFVKNGPMFAGLGEGGEGFTSFSIASPTGEGLTRPSTFSRERRCVLVDHFRIV